MARFSAAVRWQIEGLSDHGGSFDRFCKRCLRSGLLKAALLPFWFLEGPVKAQRGCFLPFSQKKSINEPVGTCRFTDFNASAWFEKPATTAVSAQYMMLFLMAILRQQRNKVCICCRKLFCKKRFLSCKAFVVISSYHLLNSSHSWFSCIPPAVLACVKFLKVWSWKNYSLCLLPAMIAVSSCKRQRRQWFCFRSLPSTTVPADMVGNWASGFNSSTEIVDVYNGQHLWQCLAEWKIFSFQRRWKICWVLLHGQCRFNFQLLLPKLWGTVSFDEQEGSFVFHACSGHYRGWQNGLFTVDRDATSAELSNNLTQKYFYSLKQAAASPGCRSGSTRQDHPAVLKGWIIPGRDDGILNNCHLSLIILRDKSTSCHTLNTSAKTKKLAISF